MGLISRVSSRTYREKSNLSLFQMEKSSSKSKNSPEKNRQTKIKGYETFINEKLKTALEGDTREQKKVSEEITSYTQLKRLIEITKQSQQTKIKTKVDLG